MIKSKCNKFQPNKFSQSEFGKLTLNTKWNEKFLDLYKGYGNQYTTILRELRVNVQQLVIARNKILRSLKKVIINNEKTDFHTNYPYTKEALGSIAENTLKMKETGLF